MSINQTLLNEIKARGESSTPYGQGIMTADRYVKTLHECAGSDMCYQFAATKQNSFDDVLRKAASTLVYRNEDMVADKDSIDFKAGAYGGIELPKDTLVVFRHVLTTPRKDRDGDILRTQGAEVDPKMLLLWQHVHTLPIGKMLGVVSHTDKSLELVSAIVDMNAVCHDAAVMVDNDMARFSHGFRALEFDRLKDDDGQDLGGFDIKRFEVMEESIVSIPSNADAENTEVLLSLVEGGKLTSQMMKEVGKTIRAKRPLQVAGVEIDELPAKDQKPGCACEGKSGTPTKENEPAEVVEKDEEAGQAKDTQVEAKAYSDGCVDGSWEEIQRCLSKQLYKYMEKSDTNTDDCYCYCVATYDDYVVVCCEKYEYGSDDEYTYCKVGWAYEESMPKLTGEPSPVDVTISVDDKQALVDTKDTRNPEHTPSPETAVESGAKFLAESTVEERSRLKHAIEAIEQSEKSARKGKEYTSLLGAK